MADAASGAAATPGALLGSAREVQACLDVAAAWGYLDAAGKAVQVSVDHMTAMLFKLLR
ncbi:MAG TPA: hypothetical protein VFZ61_20495 [Polyangiales bacterium]